MIRIPITLIALLAATTPALAAQVEDKVAIVIGAPQEMVFGHSMPHATVEAMLKPVKVALWFQEQRQGGVACSGAFELKVVVEHRLIVGDRVVSHGRFTGRFTGVFMYTESAGRRVDFVATDLLRVRDGRITDARPELGVS